MEEANSGEEIIYARHGLVVFSPILQFATLLGMLQIFKTSVYLFILAFEENLQVLGYLPSTRLSYPRGCAAMGLWWWSGTGLLNEGWMGLVGNLPMCSVYRVYPDTSA